jgi:multiple sugar transport system permease protein
VLFVLPALALLLVFRVYPLIRGAFFSVTGDRERNGVFIGLDNYTELFADSGFLQSLRNIGILLVLLPIYVAIPLALAIFIHLKIPGHRIYRAVYFFPVVLSPVIIGAIFNQVLAVDGPINQALARAGLDVPIDWLGSKTTALYSVLAVQIWATFGLAVVVILAGLSTLDQELLDAAKMDGANLWQQIRHVILPSLLPTIQFVFVTTTIGLLTGMFGLLFVMTAGGPGTATYLPEFFIWLQQGQMGRPAFASAASMVLFAVMAIIALIQIRILRREEI